MWPYDSKAAVGTRQAVIKTLVRQGLDQRHMARAARAKAKRS